MAGIMKFKKIKPRMIFWIFTAVLLPVIVACSTIYYQRVTAIKTREYTKLTAIRNLKVAQLNSWFVERKNDFVSISSNIMQIRQIADVFAKKELTENDKNIIMAVKNILDSYVENYDAYHEVFIINTFTGIIEISTDRSSVGRNVSQKPYFIEPLKTGNFFISDIYYSNQLKSPVMCFAIPIKSLNSVGEKQSAILVARIDLEHSLYDLLLERTGMEKTGEILIVNKDLMALNELRWYKNAPLKLKIRTKPAVLAAQGNFGVIESTDYREVKVLASYTYLPETQWGFVVKQDVSEIYAPIKSMMIHIVVILLISIVFAYALAHMLAVNFSKPIIEFIDIAKQIQEGNLSARSTIINDDEYGILSRTFNSMAESMENYRTIQNALRTLDEILVISTNLNDFGEKFIERIVKNTKSNFGAFYLFHPDKNKFEHVFSSGFDVERMKTLDQSAIKGAFDRAFTTRKITYTHEISQDTVFTVNTIAGTALPKILATIPILNKDQVIAMLALGSFADYSKTSLEILEQLQFGTGIALSNMISGEKTSSLAQELKGKNMELEAQAQELHAMTDDLKHQNIELDVQAQKLEEASRLKSEFLSNMSHELRTPLNSVMALSSVLKMNAAEKLDTEELEYLDVINRNGKNLLNLINDILDLSKIEAGHMDVTLSFFNLKITIEDLLDSLHPLAAEKELSFRMDIAPDLPKIQSDEKRVHQILLNLIGNAVKFTEKGEVAVHVDIKNDKICIKITDTGIGIHQKDLPSIFEEFRQVDGSTSRRHEGTGLGLAIAYKATTNLGGDLSVESTPGLGTTFSLNLPLTWQGESLQIENLHSIQPSEMIESHKTILVVDDEPEAMNLIADYLSKEGYNTLKATSGAEALRLAKTHKLFAITLDLIMPGMDGFEVLEILRSDTLTMSLPVIIVTAKELTLDDKNRLNQYVVSVLSKSGLTSQSLFDEIGNYLKKIKKPFVHDSISLKHPKKRILVVEDNKAAIVQIKMILEQEGYHVDMASGGKEAQEFIQHTIPDGIILDLMMPDVDGFDVLEKMRSTKETAEIPVLVLTAKDLTPDDFKRLSANNIQQLVQKGDVVREGLLLKVKTMLGEKPEPMVCVANNTEKIKNNKIKHHDDVSKPKTKRISASVPTVLIIEDNPDNMITIKAVLKRKYTIIEAAVGEEGLKRALHELPDLILLDISLPGMDGYAVVKEIKLNERASHIPVIALTAHAMKGDREKIISAGCDDYLSKPIDPNKILEKIEKWLEQSKI